MAEFLLSAAAFVVLMVALGLVRVARGPGDADRMMAAQLLGTGAIGALLLFGAATGEGAVFDVALTLALLARLRVDRLRQVRAAPGRSRADDDAEGGCATHERGRSTLFTHRRHRRRRVLLPRRHGRACCAFPTPTRGCTR